MITIYNIKSAVRYLKNNGLREFFRRVGRFIKGDGYRDWWKNHKPTEEELNQQRAAVFAAAPLISIPVPLYNTPLTYLQEMIESVLNQTYANWELCLADGSTQDQAEQFVRERYAGESRIRYKRLEQNRGISGNTNEAVSMAEGEYIGLLDHDDLLAPNALFEVVKIINEYADADVIYTDEDKVSDDITDHFDPAFKPDFNLDLLRSCNYICHFFVVKRGIAEDIHGFRSEFDGSQDYDFILRCVEKARHVYHIPKMLYHWRCHPNSVAGNPENKLYAYEAGRRAVEEHLNRIGKPEARVEQLPFWGHYRVDYPVKSRDDVSVVILHQEHGKGLRRCVDSVLTKTLYENYHICIAEIGCAEPQVMSLLREAGNNSKVTVLRQEQTQTVSSAAAFNHIVKNCGGRYLVFLYENTEVISPDWLDRMLGNCQREEVGITGAKLYTKNNSISHAGIVVGLGGTAGHVLTGESRRAPGYLNRLQIQLNYSAVTGDCMMISRQLFEELGGFDENLGMTLYDTDLCLRAGEKDKLVVFDPKIELYRYQSETARKGRTAACAESVRVQQEQEEQYFRGRWKKMLEKGDPCYNRNWTLERGDFSIRRDDYRL